jgi:hypothetical protein
MNNIFGKYLETNKERDYHGVYEDAFLSLEKENIKLVFEIGVLGGGSLRGFRDYFQNALIIGIDIIPEFKFEEERIFVEIGNACDKEFIESIITKYGYPDIVIDDGSHYSSDIKKTFNLLYEKTKKCYVIEDYGTQRKDFQNGELINDGVPATTIMYKFIDDLMANNILKSIKIYYSICFFFKN